MIGFILTLTLFLLRRKSRDKEAVNKSLNRRMSVATRGCSVFYDCAVFFTFSIQLACIVVLARLDFGISATGMGDSTAKITWAVSLLTILPLMYIAFNPKLLREPSTVNAAAAKSQGKKDRKEQLRFLLFALCWLLFMYPLLSRMMQTFGKSAIGGDSPVISTGDWSSIETSCLVNVHDITTKETIAMNIFGVSGSLFVSVLALAKIIWLAAQRQHRHSRLVQHIRERRPKTNSRHPLLSIVLFVVIPILVVSQCWTVSRLRAFQAQVSSASGNSDSDGQWTFGQIAAMTVFAPVLVQRPFWCNARLPGCMADGAAAWGKPGGVLINIKWLRLPHE